MAIKRPFGIILTSAVQILGSLLVLLMAVMALILPHLNSKVPSGQPQMSSGFFFAVGAMYLVFAAIGIATAVDVFRMKRWSRYSTLIFAGFLAFMGLILALVFAVMPFPPPAAQHSTPLPRDFALGFKTVMVSIQLAIAGLGAWWLYYFNRKVIGNLYEDETTNVSACGRRPLSIVVLALLSLLGLPWSLIALWIGSPIMLFGLVMHGSLAKLTYVGFFALNLYLGIGLLRLAPASRLMGIGIYLFGCLNAVICWALPGRDERYQYVLAESSRVWHLPTLSRPSPQPMQGAWITVIATVLFSAVAIYFLIVRRSAFENRPPISKPADGSVLA